MQPFKSQSLIHVLLRSTRDGINTLTFMDNQNVLVSNAQGDGF